MSFGIFGGVGSGERGGHVAVLGPSGCMMCGAQANVLLQLVADRNISEQG